MEQANKGNTGLSVTVVQADDLLSHVALAGQMTQLGVERATSEFLTCTAKRGLDTIVDLSGVTFMASAGLGLLAAARKQLLKAGAKIVLLSPTAQVAGAIRASRLDILLPITDTLDEALARLGLDDA
jgi:anti-sigma B factor antagonist